MEKRTENALARQSLQNFGSTGDMNAVFEIYKNLGLIPPQYRNWVDLTLAYHNKVESGLTAAQANKELGIKTQKTIFKSRVSLADDLFDAWIQNDEQFSFSSGAKKFNLISKLRKQFSIVKKEDGELKKGDQASSFELLREAANRSGLSLNLDAPYFLDVRVIGPNRRTVRFNPHESALRLIQEKHGPELVKLFKKFLNDGWTSVASQETKLMQQLTGRSHDRGHFFSAYYGGPPDVENQSAELTDLNQRHRPDDNRLPQEPRFEPEAMRRAGIPDNTLQSFYELALRSTGQLRGSGLQNRLSPYLTNLVDMNEISPDQAVAIQDQLEQRSQQQDLSGTISKWIKGEDTEGSFDRFIKGQMSANYEKALAELSPSLSQERAPGGPVTVVQEGIKPTTVIDPKDGSKRISRFGVPSMGTVIRNGALHFAKTQIPGPEDVLQSALASNVGQELGKGNIPGALKETGKNLVGGLVQQFTTPEGLLTTAGMAGAAAVAPAAAGVVGGALGIAAGIQGTMDLIEGAQASSEGFDNVDDYRQDKALKRDQEAEKLSKTLLKIQRQKKAKAKADNGQMSLPLGSP